MSDTVQNRIYWDAPRVAEYQDHTEIEFRDARIRLVDGLVAEYVDIERGVKLCPLPEDPEEWLVFNSAGEPTNKRWRGFIAFDGSQLLIQQEKHSRLKVYRLDGTVETQLRISRITEVPGTRTTAFHVGVVVTEDLATNETLVNFGDRLVKRLASGEGFISLDNGVTFSPEVLSNSDPLEEPTNPALVAYSHYLRSWTEFAFEDDQIFVLEAPPAMHHEPGRGVREKAPGNKPDNIRECRRNEFSDGVTLYQYCGRYAGIPYLSHELVSRTGLLLARSIEYDQAQRIVFQFHDGEREILDGVVTVDSEFDPENLMYSTRIGFQDGLTTSYHGPVLEARSLSEAPK